MFLLYKRVLILIIVFVFFTIANTSSVLLTTNGNGKENVFCPRELIVVKCSVKGSALRWHIGKASFAIFHLNRTVTFFAGLNGEGLHSYMYSAIGRLDFYQNATYVASSAADSSIDSELHMHLNDVNDFVEVICEDLYQKKKRINITALHGMLKFFGIIIKLLYYY